MLGQIRYPSPEEMEAQRKDMLHWRSKAEFAEKLRRECETDAAREITSFRVLFWFCVYLSASICVVAIPVLCIARYFGLFGLH